MASTSAAVALGAPQWRVVLIVTLRAVKGGVVTGVLLALARISGETAPLLFTALNNQFWSTDLNAPMANLPVVIFQYAASPYESWQALAWAGAFVGWRGVHLGVAALSGVVKAVTGFGFGWWGVAIAAAIFGIGTNVLSNRNPASVEAAAKALGVTHLAWAPALSP